MLRIQASFANVGANKNNVQNKQRSYITKSNFNGKCDKVSFSGSIEKKLINNSSNISLIIPKVIAELMGLDLGEAFVKLNLQDNKISMVKSDIEKKSSLIRKVLLANKRSATVNMPKALLDLMGVDPKADMVKLDYKDSELIISKGRRIKKGA